MTIITRPPNPRKSRQGTDQDVEPAERHELIHEKKDREGLGRLIRLGLAGPPQPVPHSRPRSFDGLTLLQDADGLLEQDTDQGCQRLEVVG